MEMVGRPEGCRQRKVLMQGVTSHNTYVTLLTNLGQFRIPSHLSRHHRTTSPERHLSILIPVCPLVSDFCLVNLVQEYPLHLLLCLIVFLFLLTLDSQ